MGRVSSMIESLEYIAATGLPTIGTGDKSRTRQERKPGELIKRRPKEGNSSSAGRRDGCLYLI